MSKYSYDTNMVQSSVEGSIYNNYKSDFSSTGYDKYQSHKGSKIVTSFFTIFLVILLLSAIFGALTGSTHNLTFTGFLDWLSTYEPAIPNVKFVSHSITGDWGIFDILRKPVKVRL